MSDIFPERPASSDGRTLRRAGFVGGRAMERALLCGLVLIANEAARFLTESNRTLQDEAARVAEHTTRAEALRALKDRVKAAAADGTVDPKELQAIEAEAHRLGVHDAIAPALDRLRETSAAGAAVGDLQNALSTELRAALSAARPSVALQLAVQNEQMAMQMFSATMQAYHRTGMNIIANLKA